MKDLDKIFGKSRIIDTPVSESATTGFAVGASLCGSMPIVVHPRMDFMLYAIDPIVNQAAKWSHMTGGTSNPGVTVRSIINRGGEQGAQHSQSLHSWFAHIPGLRVVMPYTVQDARDLLISSVLCKDPVIYIDDRWLYSLTEEIDDSITEKELHKEKPMVIKQGSDLTLVGNSFSTYLAVQVADELQKLGTSCEVIDIRVLNPYDPETVINSVAKTRKLLVIDGGWKNSGFAAEILASIHEKADSEFPAFISKRISLANSPAPTSRKLEEIYYPTKEVIIEEAKNIVSKS